MKLVLATLTAAVLFTLFWVIVAIDGVLNNREPIAESED